MGLKVYASANSSSDFSTGGTFTKPIAYSFDGVSGGVLVKQFYLRNDDVTKYYTNVTLSAYVASGQDITDGTDGFTWKMISGSSQPLEQEWGLVVAANTLSMSQIGSSGNGDNYTYYPFWLRIEVPSNLFVQAFENVKIRISYTENLA